MMNETPGKYRAFLVSRNLALRQALPDMADLVSFSFDNKIPLLV